MSARYLPNKTPIVCTYQTDPAPRKLAVVRSQVSVMYKSKKEPLLTIADKNTDSPFTCKISMNLAGSLFAFGAGLLVGALLILSGPVGWAVIAVASVMIVAAATTYIVAKINHTCTPNLQAGMWSLQHSTVKFDQQSAITQMSILTCGKSGILKPIIDPALALSAAQDISSGNRIEIGANMAISFLFGFGVVGAGAGGAVAVRKMILGTVIGTPIISFMVTAEKKAIRSLSLNDNESYERLNNAENLSFIPEWFSDPSTIDPSDPENMYDYDSPKYIKDVMGALRTSKTNGESLAIYKKLQDAPSRQVRRAIIRDLVKEKNPEILRAIKEYGKTSLTKNQVGTQVTEKGKIIRTSNKLALQKGIESISVVALVLPFISAWFTEIARKDLAIAAEQDLNGGGSIIAQTPI